MTPVPDPRDAVKLRADLTRELGALSRAEGRVKELARELALPGASDKEESALGKRLSDAYTAMERTFRSVAVAFEGVPRGPDLSRGFLTAMRTDIPQLRPKVISVETVRKVEEFLGFRHFFRSLYADDLLPHRLMDLAAQLPEASLAFRADLAQFDRFLEKLAAARPDK